MIPSQNAPMHSGWKLKQMKGSGSGKQENGHTVELVEKRWQDFSFCEPGGEPLGSVQKRNIEALNEVLVSHKDKNIVIGTHGTALSTILHYTIQVTGAMASSAYGTGCHTLSGLILTGPNISASRNY